MSAGTREKDVRKRVVGRYDDLPPQQRRVADWLLEHLAEVPFLGIPELAQRAGASEATVVRFCQSLDYDGFAGLRQDLVQGLRRRVGLGPETGLRDSLPPDPGEDTLAAVAARESGNIERSISQLDRTVFRDAAAALFRADHVFTFGLGISSHLAAILAYLLTQIGLRASAVPTGYTSALEPLLPLRPTDVLVAFSFPPYSRATIDAVRSAADRGVPTVAICDRLTAPAGTVARHTLAVASDNMMFTNSFAAVSVLLNALTTEIALRHRDHAARAVDRVSRLLDDDDGVLLR